MRTKWHLIALAAALGVLPTAAAAARTNASANASQTIKFAVAFHDVQLDLGKKGPSVGDERIVADSLLDAKGRKVGHDAGVCTFTSARTARGGLPDHVFPPAMVRSRHSSSTPRRHARSQRSSVAPAPIEARAGRPSSSKAPSRPARSLFG